MNTTVHIGFFDLFIFLGVFQGLLLSWFFIKNSRTGQKANLYQGLLILFLSLGIFEELLNNTGYIVFVLPLSDFAEPLNFTYGPLFYLYVRSTLDPKEREKVWPHFILGVFWLFYMVFYFIQPDELKYNSYIHTKHPDWEYLSVTLQVSDDPLWIRNFTNELLGLQFVAYLGASIVALIRKFMSMSQPLFRTTNESLVVLRNTTFHFIIIIVVFFVTKFTFGMDSDVGGYWIAAYISFMIFATSFQILNRSDFFNHPHSFLDFPMPKYRKSSLTEEQKMGILAKVKAEMEENKYYTGSWHHLWFIAYLFVMALFLSPFLGFTRSFHFQRFRNWLEKWVTRKLGLNLVLIPLVLSQIILRPFFPNETHALVDDWASFTFSFIFFVSGFVLLSSNIIGEAIKDQRWWYLGESAIATTFMFLTPTLFTEKATIDIAWDYSAIVVSWSCSITAIGFARRYLNRDSRFRKLANEAIYPFYLLHQPIIIVIGFYMVQWDIHVLWKVLFITSSSFTATVAIYWFLIRPFNAMRIIFGMKPMQSQKKESWKGETILAPVHAD